MSYQEFTRLFNEKIEGLDHNRLIRELKISRPTFNRWTSGESAPHQTGRKAVFDLLDKLNGV